MELLELNEAIKAKTSELEMATELGKPKEEILKIYKELKELQFKKVQHDLSSSVE